MARAAAARIAASNRFRARSLIHSRLISGDELLRMLRGQLLTDEHPPRCRDKNRLYGQLAIKHPAGRVPHPPNELRCPLMERGQAGDRTVPCSEAYEEAEEWPQDKDARAATDEEKWLQEGETPCAIMSHLVFQQLSELIGLPKDRPRFPSTEEPHKQKLRALEQEILEAKEAGTLRPAPVLRLMVESGRMTDDEIHTLFEFGIHVFYRDWLPCRDDEARTVVFDPESIENADHEWIPFSRMMCPLQVRALLGDKTVPCAYMLEGKQNEYFMQQARKVYPEGLPEQKVVEYWDDPEQAPGQPGDIVRKLSVVPCAYLGALLARELIPLVNRLLEANEMLDHDIKVLNLYPETQPAEAEDTVW